MNTIKLSKPDRDMVYETACRLTGCRALRSNKKIRVSERVGLKTGVTSVNKLIAGENELGDETDHADYREWKHVWKAIPVKADGKALLDLFLYSMVDTPDDIELETTLQILLDSEGIYEMRENGRKIWSETP